MGEMDTHYPPEAIWDDDWQAWLDEARRDREEREILPGNTLAQPPFELVADPAEALPTFAYWSPGALDADR